jgi:hypothetical protein
LQSDYPITAAGEQMQRSARAEFAELLDSYAVALMLRRRGGAIDGPDFEDAYFDLVAHDRMQLRDRLLKFFGSFLLFFAGVMATVGLEAGISVVTGPTCLGAAMLLAIAGAFFQVFRLRRP